MRRYQYIRIGKEQNTVLVVLPIPIDQKLVTNVYTYQRFRETAINDARDGNYRTLKKETEQRTALIQRVREAGGTMLFGFHAILSLERQKRKK